MQTCAHPSVGHVYSCSHGSVLQLLFCVPKYCLIFKPVYTHCAPASLNMNIL